MVYAVLLHSLDQCKHLLVLHQRGKRSYCVVVDYLQSMVLFVQLGLVHSHKFSVKVQLG